MNNLQLAIFLEHYLDDLKDLRVNLIESLPEELIVRKKFLGQELIPQAECLCSLDDAIENLKFDIERLSISANDNEDKQRKQK